MRCCGIRRQPLTYTADRHSLHVVVECVYPSTLSILLTVQCDVVGVLESALKSNRGERGHVYSSPSHSSLTLQYYMMGIAKTLIGIAFSSRCERSQLRQICLSLPIPFTTLQNQRARRIVVEPERVPSQLNRSQQRQVYSVIAPHDTHSQTQHAHSSRMLLYRSRVSSASLDLFVIALINSDPSTPTTQRRSCSSSRSSRPL